MSGTKQSNTVETIAQHVAGFFLLFSSQCLNFSVIYLGKGMFRVKKAIVNE